MGFWRVQLVWHDWKIGECIEGEGGWHAGGRGHPHVTGWLRVDCRSKIEIKIALG